MNGPNANKFIISSFGFVVSKLNNTPNFPIFFFSDECVYEKFISALEKEGGALLSLEEKKILGKKMWNEDRIINRDIIAKRVYKIATLAGLDTKKYSKTEFLMVEEDGIGENYPFSREKLSPVLAVYRARDFDHAVDLANKILQHQGQGHSCSIHSQNEDNIMRLGNELPVCRIIVNQAHCFATGGNFDNSLPFSLSMGWATISLTKISATVIT
jgi:sulfoacetaldehyde dehydrogenase